MSLIYEPATEPLHNSDVSDNGRRNKGLREAKRKAQVEERSRIEATLATAVQPYTFVHSSLHLRPFIPTPPSIHPYT